MRLLFSGDVGRKNLPIIKDPDPAPAADYLIMESTYGDRLHPPIGDVKAKLAALVKDGWREAGTSLCRRLRWSGRSNWCCCCMR